VSADALDAVSAEARGIVSVDELEAMSDGAPFTDGAPLSDGDLEAVSDGALEAVSAGSLDDVSDRALEAVYAVSLDAVSVWTKLDMLLALVTLHFFGCLRHIDSTWSHVIDILI
jgi:hypothetical protein